MFQLALAGHTLKDMTGQTAAESQKISLTWPSLGDD